mmetsp:Transcript_8996/g.27349  ORF Transcript_8996/g.27349 Transcript_8996/m.27349 type:complete len:277 (+) Transcript_8996:36-866(+)
MHARMHAPARLDASPEASGPVEERILLFLRLLLLLLHAEHPPPPAAEAASKASAHHHCKEGGSGGREGAECERSPAGRHNRAVQGKLAARGGLLFLHHSAHQLRLPPVLWAGGVGHAKPATGDVKDDVLVEHPGDAQDRLVQGVLQEGVAPSARRAPLVEVPVWQPFDVHAAHEVQLHRGELLRPLVGLPQAPTLVAAVHIADRRIQIFSAAPIVEIAVGPQLGEDGAVHEPWEVGVGRPAVNDGGTEGRRRKDDGDVAERQLLREDEVVHGGVHA